MRGWGWQPTLPPCGRGSSVDFTAAPAANWAVSSRPLLLVVPDLEQQSRCRALQPPTLMLVRESDSAMKPNPLITLTRFGWLMSVPVMPVARGALLR